MCSNYIPVTAADRMLTFFGVEVDPSQPLRAEVYPLGLAPFVRLHEDGSGNRVIDGGQFGLLPAFAKELAFGRRTYNARSETVHQKPSFRRAWAKSRRCIIPAEVVYEQCWESGKAERWAVQRPNAIPMGIAGIYEKWLDADGRVRGTFAMLTCNADGHPVYGRFFAPGEEKRMIVILDPADYDRWLQCPPEEAKSFLKQWHGPLQSHPAPRGRSGVRKESL
jgi:putative SOS response-associated peptidase YedK